MLLARSLPREINRMPISLLAMSEPFFLIIRITHLAMRLPRNDERKICVSGVIQYMLPTEIPS